MGISGKHEPLKEEDSELSDKLKTAQMRKLLKPYFWPHLWSQRLRAFLAILCIIGGKACRVYAPLFIGRATDKLSSSDPEFPFEETIVYVVLGFLTSGFMELKNYLYIRVKQTAYAEIADKTFIHLHTLSVNWHLTKTTGKVLRAIDRGIASANSVVSYLFLNLVPTLCECVAVSVIFLVHFGEGPLALAVLVAVTVYCVLTVRVAMWRKRLRKVMNESDNDAQTRAVDSFTNFETVRFFTNENYERTRYGDAIVEYQKATVKNNASLNILNASQQFIIQCTLAVGLLWSAKRVVDGDMSVGDFVTVNVYVMQLFQPLTFLGTVYTAVTQAFVDMSNLSELLVILPDVTDDPDAKPLVILRPEQPNEPSMSQRLSSNHHSGKDEDEGVELMETGKLTPVRGATVEFRNVSFHYPTQPKENGLKSISFRVPAGTTTALVGHTGSGKSTVSRLLFRFYDPAEGSVEINGVDIRHVTQASVRANIGIVPQDAVLFNDTLRYNVRYGKLSATDAEVEEACRAASLHDFVNTLPDGYETRVGERGLKLSGGEKQRVAIARTILKNPPILVLDEATSALDTMTEREIQASLEMVCRNRTTLVIAHRLSTITHADQILVLSRGDVVERGSHQQLLELKGQYYAMWMEQLSSPEGEEVSTAVPVVPAIPATDEARQGMSDPYGVEYYDGYN
eukprot:Rmarinus@m.9012